MKKQLTLEISSSGAYDIMWEQFAKDRRESRAMAYVNLQQNLAKFAGKLVPDYFTAKEHLSVVAEIETHTKSDQQSNDGDPTQIMGEWLRGERDLSRTQMDTVREKVQ
jgi:hypothetical protein